MDWENILEHGPSYSGTTEDEAVCLSCESLTDEYYCIHPKYNCHPYHGFVVYCNGLIRLEIQ